MEEEIKKLEDFIAGKFDDREAKQYSEVLKKDSKKKQFIRNYFLTKRSIELSSDDKLKRELIELGRKKLHETKNNIFSRKWYFISAAALLIIFFSIYFGIIKNSTSKDYKKLYLSYYAKPEPVEYSLRSTNSILLWDKSQAFYQQNLYDSSLLYLTQLKALQDFRNPSLVDFYLGIIKMEKGLYDEALENFNHVNPTSSIAKETHWYKALTFLRLNNLDECKLILNKIEQDKSHKYNSRARKLLKRI